MTDDIVVRAVDIDTHEMIPFHMWGETFGEHIATRMARCGESPFFTDNGANTSVRPDVLADDAVITVESVATSKGVAAPGAIDLRRREAVMDALGVDKSLLFPSFGLVGMLMASSPELVAQFMQLGFDVDETRTVGLEVIEAYNDWVIRACADVDQRRLRPVAIVLTDSIEQMVADLDALIDRGIGAIWIPSGRPPAHTSPADVSLDPFWRLAADNDVAVLIHIGTDFDFAASLDWPANVPAFVPPRASAEFPISPFQGATTHLGAEHYLTALVLGGVFERVPTLRVGAIEIGAQWLGPLADRLDTWAEVFARALADVISHPPSFYLNRNVRVAPLHFEKIDVFFERYPHLQDCFCFATDYPHVEGGPDARAVFTDRLARLDPLLTRKFLTNGEWLVPDRVARAKR